jgi:hypothetical protein
MLNEINEHQKFFVGNKLDGATFCHKVCYHQTNKNIIFTNLKLFEQIKILINGLHEKVLWWKLKNILSLFQTIVNISAVILYEDIYLYQQTVNIMKYNLNLNNSFCNDVCTEQKQH